MEMLNLHVSMAQTSSFTPLAIQDLLLVAGPSWQSLDMSGFISFERPNASIDRSPGGHIVRI